ncbi:hypothetical protein CBS101457_003137 [Exobasidium rhododendri]|nr:hypothetical protein CBS101457_003137 [Exobasidium rhododendri]
MANPRQRRKARSGSSTKPSDRSKRQALKKLVRAPPIKGAQVIQDNWDPKMTVRQNYQRLGLMGNLSMRDSGGKEKEYELQSKSIPESASRKAQHQGGMAKVQRDAKGKIILVEEREKLRENTAWGPALNSDDEFDDGDAIEGDNGEDMEEEEEEEEEGENEDDTQVKKDVAKSLEELSKTVKPVVRYTSQAEKSWLHRLVAKHGSDTLSMSRDRLDNIWQKTEGEIKRAIKKASGVEALQS